MAELDTESLAEELSETVLKELEESGTSITKNWGVIKAVMASVAHLSGVLCRHIRMLERRCASADSIAEDLDRRLAALERLK